MINVKINTYKYSKDIAEFNYDENNKILKKICKTTLNKIDIPNILYVVSLIELLGPKYINMAIMLHKNNFMIIHNEFADIIGEYINYQNHNGASYTLVMRNAAKIIEYKYNNRTQLQKNTKNYL